MKLYKGGGTLCKGLGDRHYAKVGDWTLYKGGRTLYKGETDFIMVPQFFAVSRFSFVAKDIGIPIVFIQNGGDGKSIENDNRLRLSM